MLKKKPGRLRKSMPTTADSSLPQSAAVAADAASMPSSSITSDARSGFAAPQATLQTGQKSTIPLEDLPSPPIEAALESAKLSALHARLALPHQLPLQTLARALVHPTADPDTRFNNASLALLGNDLLGYHMGEHLLAKYPRLPTLLLYAAMTAYVGPRSLNAVAQEWGIEAAAEPGGEVDAGLLQFQRAAPGTPTHQVVKSNRPEEKFKQEGKTPWRRGVSSRVVYDDQFGELRNTTLDPSASPAPGVVSIEEASATFIRALMGAIYLHSGAAATHEFFTNHFLSRHLDLGSLFTFTEPTRDLSRLCAREGFDSPVARLESETGRLSRAPVYVVGVYSGPDKLGEGAGSSLDEARFRAAVSALKGWYLYSPPGDVVMPSQAHKGFTPIMVDGGEVVV